MKKLILIVCMLAFAAAAQAQYFRIPAGPYAGNIQKMTFAANGNIFVAERTAGGGRGVCRSTDGGQTWKFINNGLPSTSTSTVIQAKNGTLLASTGFELYKSTNNGDAWTKATTTTFNWIRAIVASNGTIYLTNENDPDGFYKSTDHGTTWTRSGTFPYPGFLALDSTGVLYAAQSTSSIVKKSIDSGKTWTTLSGFPGSRFAISREGHVYAVGSSSVLKSVDRGATWRTMYTDDAVPGHTGINISPTGTVWVGSYESSAFSLDTGKTWTKIDSGLNRSRKQVFAVGDFTFGPKGEVYAVTGAGIYQLSADKKYWQGIGLPTSAVMSVHACKEQLWATVTNGIMLSTDKGATWAHRNLPTFSQSGRIIANDTAVFVVNPSKKISYSTNRGIVWFDFMTGMETESVNDLFFTKTGAFLAATTKGIFKLTSAGWVNKTTVSSGYSKLTSASTGILMALGGKTGLQRSTDNGETWDTTQVITNILAISGDSSGNFWAGVNYLGDIYKSTDGGKSFNKYLTLSTGKTNAFAPDKWGNLFVIPGTGNVRKVRDSASTTITAYSAGAAIGYNNPCFDDDGYLYIGTGGDGLVISATPTLQSTGPEEAVQPESFMLSQNFPNPFNPETTIEFCLPENADVRVTVFDVLGRETASLANGPLSAGNHRISFNAAGMASGIYFYRLDAVSGQSADRRFTEVKKMTLMR